MSEYATAYSAEAGLGVSNYAGIRSWSVIDVGLDVSATPVLIFELMFIFTP